MAKFPFPMHVYFHYCPITTQADCLASIIYSSSRIIYMQLKKVSRNKRNSVRIAKRLRFTSHYAADATCLSNLNGSRHLLSCNFLIFCLSVEKTFS